MKNLEATLNLTRGYNNLTSGKIYEIITFSASYTENLFTFPEYFAIYNDKQKLTTLHASRFSVDATTRKALDELSEKLYIVHPHFRP